MTKGYDELKKGNIFSAFIVQIDSAGGSDERPGEGVAAGARAVAVIRVHQHEVEHRESLSVSDVSEHSDKHYAKQV